ncbi:hypothetical protein NBRC111894_1890 [Sporolactobacillus inulinus]|uniref:Uncharacterized protein n=1 Tax=Sporolactobacillus inulinus TaxID=2078 RepID=A0A4Y1ZB78_9BACL|nr:hypothetical protein NBRC111894_1890 [Sporolactobacillus inulinus]
MAFIYIRKRRKVIDIAAFFFIYRSFGESGLRRTQRDGKVKRADSGYR